jgi:predicted O-methyltransferase YrrM
VEIGSFRGRSTLALGLASDAEVEVIAIDPHLGSDRGPREIHAQPGLGSSDHEAFHANLERTGLAGRVRHVRVASQEALNEVDGEVDLLYVDGAHRYRPAAADLQIWGDRLGPGGRMLVHDAFSSVGVTLALAQAVIGRREWRYLGRTGSLAEFERSELDLRRRLGELIKGLAQLPWFTRNLLIKVLIVGGMRPLTRLLGHDGEGWPY